MTQSPRVRFAPSPTGLLHIGGARTAIYNWAYARHFNGTFILRIDDTDPERSTQENTEAILRAMQWLGLDWDEGPDVGGDFGPYFQTKRANLYVDALEELKARDAVYPCFCSAEKLAAEREAARERQDSFQGYQQTCRKIPRDEAQARIDAGEPHTWRIKVPQSRGNIVFDDSVHGVCSFDAAQQDDFILVRSDGTPTYNYATVIDDAAMEITHVIRGDDHLSNTPRQVLIFEALGKPVPLFAHLSMILGPDGKRLSKRHGATSVEEYRDRGFLPEALVNYLALLGWSLDGETTLFSRETLQQNFDLDRISKNPAVFDEAKLLWMNGEYFKAMTPDEFCTRAMMPELERAHLATMQDYVDNPAWFFTLVPLINERIKLAEEIPSKVAYLFEQEPIELDAKSAEKNLAKPGAHESLLAAQEALTQLSEEDWTAQEIDAALEPIPEALDLKKKIVFQAIRVAVCGNQVSLPLGESMQLLGKPRSLKRLADALCTAQLDDVQ